MGSIKYIGDGSDEPITWGGQTFEPGKSIKVDNVALLAKASSNPFFEVSGFKPEMLDEAEPRRINYASGLGQVSASTDAAGPTSATVRSAAVEAANPAARPADLEESLTATYGVPNPLDSQKPGKPPEASKATRKG